MQEIWKPIVGYEGYYEVSSFGRVRRIKGGCGTQVGKILEPCPLPNGYLYLCLSVNNKTERLSIHRLVCSAFHENPENKPCVNHIDGNKTNNYAENLEWVTASENMQHAYRTGLTKGNRGKHHSEETRKKMSEAKKGEFNPNYGKHFSEEHRRKLSESHKKRHVEAQMKEVV